MSNNYAAIQRRWEQMAQSWDYRERYEALGLPGYGRGKLPVHYFGQSYTIDPVTGVVADEQGNTVDFNTAMSIYALFHYSKPRAKKAGIWLAFREVPMVSQFEGSFQKQWLQPFAAAFSGKLPQLKAAGEKLGFHPLLLADVGFEAQVFDCLPIRYLFWDGDDEFPANVKVLFDANITDFVHPEMVVCIGFEGLNRLLLAAGMDRLK